MSKTEFVYTTYIKSTPKKVWDAITTREFTRQYWRMDLISDWKKGSKWQGINEGADDVNKIGEVLESVPPKKLVISWYNPEDAADKSEHSRVTFTIEAMGEMVQLQVLHDELNAGSDMAKGISGGWPRVLCSLKSFLETGAPLDVWAGYEFTCEPSGKQAKAG